MSGANHRILVVVPFALDEQTDWCAALAAARITVGTSGLDILALGEGDVEAGLAADDRVWRAMTPVGLSTGQLAVYAVEALAQMAGGNPAQPMLVVVPIGPGEALGAAIAALSGFEPMGRCASVNLGVDGLVAVKARGRLRLELACTGSTILALQPLDGVEFSADPAVGSGVSDETILTLSTPLPKAASITRRTVVGRGVNLEAAALVISGGRGLGEEGFALLDVIANELGAGLGASLAAIDLGLAPVSRQIGQSGKFVTPEIYLAVGLSGTPQHLAGVARSSRILAINKDPDAAIFDCAEVGIVADWRDALPALLEALGEQR